MKDDYLNSSRTSELWSKIKTLVSDNVSTVPLTSDEYNALSDEDKVRTDRLYAVTDDGAGSIDPSGEIYSTEETRIGTWIDGKSLYRRVFPITTPENNVTQKVIELPDENFGMVRVYGWMLDKNKNSVCIPHYSTEGNDIYATTAYYIKSDKCVYMKVMSLNGVYSGGQAFVILEYTKIGQEVS